mmetsp:Transcript_16364/g.38914  ORF Transcript_16364/g.38914 Transcript_16364/m.38914 type:complete len:303 (-) Transcript_16364:50-958(-)
MTETAFVRIDHFNDSKGYLRALEGIVTSSEHVCARVFWRQPAAGSRRAAVDVLVVFRARGEFVIDTVLTRLRTDYMDVDSRGDKCKERQSSVLRRQLAPAFDAPLLFRPSAAANPAGNPTRTKQAELWTRCDLGDSVRFAHARYADHHELLSFVSALGGSLCRDSFDESEIRGGCAVRGPVPPRDEIDAPLACVHAAGAKDLGAIMIVCEVRPNKQHTAISPHLDEAPGEGDALGVDLAAPPREGQANSELSTAVARWLRVAKGIVSVASGGKSRRKLVRVDAAAAGLSLNEVSRRLRAAAT